MPASFLKIGGELVQDAILQMVEVTQELNQHWWCRVECRQTEDRRIPVENLLGQDLQIVTRDQAGAEHVVFDGFVLEASLLYEVFGSYTARLKAVTRSFKLDLTAQEAYYRKKTLTDVAESLASADGLTADVLVQDGTKRNYVQWGDPDFRFLVRIADDHQAWIRPTAQGIQICDAFQRGAQVMWRQEGGLRAFDVAGALSAPAFDGTHSDARQMRSVTHTAVSKPAEHFGASGPLVAAVEKQSKALLPSGASFFDSRAATADEYKALLERESLRAAGNRVVGHGISQKEDLKAGDTVEIAGVLDGKGTYGLTKVIHRWAVQGYENEFWCTPWKNYVSPQPPEPSEVPGVVTARVVDHNDPRKMGRIQVQYDWQEGGPTGWIRATTPHAGQDRGFLFMPEIGDEVVVAFEHGDPERPYVVGYLWNGIDQAPREEFWGEDIDPNDVKRIVTKSGHRIQFVDKPGKESIVIATPQHLKISLIEKADETGRSMILLHSDGDIFINAPGGRVHLHSASLSQDVGGSGQAPSAAGGNAGSSATSAPVTTGPAPSHMAVGPTAPGQSPTARSGGPTPAAQPSVGAPSSGSKAPSPVVGSKSVPLRTPAPPAPGARRAEVVAEPVPGKIGPVHAPPGPKVPERSPAKPAALGTSKTPPTPLKAPPVVCALSDVTAHCSHDREASQKGRYLAVVAPAAGDAITFQAAAKGGCGKHPHWSASGEAADVLQMAGLTAVVRARNWAWNDPQSWCPDARPKTFSMTVEMCEGRGDFVVAVYPGNKRSQKFGLETLSELADHIKPFLEKVFSWFTLEKPELELFKGAVERGWEWKEDKNSPECFYAFEVMIGFRPLIKVDFDFPIHFLPPATELLGAPCFFLGLCGAANVDLFWRKEVKDRHDCGGELEAVIKGSFGLRSVLFHKKILKAEVAAETGLIVVAKPFMRGMEPMASLEFKWAPGKGTLTIEALWGAYEKTREVKFWDEKSCYEREWPAAEEKLGL